MEKIIITEPKQVKVQSKPQPAPPFFWKKGKLKQIGCRLDQFLIVKCRNIITSKNLAGDYSINSLSDLVRRSCQSCQQNGVLNLTVDRNLANPRQNTTLLLDEATYQIYQS